MRPLTPQQLETLKDLLDKRIAARIAVMINPDDGVTLAQEGCAYKDLRVFLQKAVGPVDVTSVTDTARATLDAHGVPHG